TENISDYVRKCCISGIRKARTTSSCLDNELSVSIIPQLWIGLCHSTFEVCCSREVDHQNCELGRLAALDGTRCERGENVTSDSFTSCCRSCQIGLAVKASKVNCKDPLFSFLSAIESYRACCNEDDDFTIETDSSKSYNTISKDDDLKKKINSENNPEGTIILTNDDDICGQIPNLCAHICENTFDAYQCKCHVGFKLDSNNVTCSEEKDICPSGFDFDVLQAKCVDIDECRDQIHECKISQYCYNTIGGYHCLNVKAKHCPPGSYFESELEECQEKNEKQQHYINKSTSLTTPKNNLCGVGFIIQNDRCADIDECAHSSTNNCTVYSHKECKNSLGSYSCECKTGFNLDITLQECVDINECSINNHNCLPTQRCDNTIGSYICTRLQSCGTGYTLNAETGNCDDDDECALNTHNCLFNYDCYNTKGSFRCYRKTTTPKTTIAATTAITPAFSEMIHKKNNVSKHPYSSETRPGISYSTRPVSRFSCSPGFFRNGLGACVDINECQENNPCDNNELCINTNGHFRCDKLLICSSGFKSSLDGKSCIDIDECETGEHNCRERQICRNRNGGYVCECPLGHELKRLSNGANSCIDINECTLDQRVCPSNSYCYNTIGSYYCECKTGFEKKMDANDNVKTSCFDIDECQTVPGLCQQKCVNFWGGYRCTCSSGYQIGSDNRTCNDINECEVHKDYKICMGYCINTPGSYQCSCPRGYSLSADMNTCRDIDECATDHVCTGRNDICTNTRGSFKCTTINCPIGYAIDSEQKNRCRQNSIICEGEDCYTKPSAYTYNFITFVSKLIIPPEGRIIFTLRGPLWYDNIDFDLKLVRVQATTNIVKASEANFETIKQNNQVSLLLKESLEGPQDIELELSMTVFTNGMPRGKSVAKLLLFVSQYMF
ncbi:hypothetical protein KR018_008931, partial [Drosophila ironensis]